MKASVAVTWVVAACLALDEAQAADVLTSRNNNERTGANLEETILTATNVNAEEFGFLFDYDVKDDVYAQPLFVSDLDIPGKGRRNVVFVANVNNDVFAFDADGRLPGEDGVLWSRNLGTPETIKDVIAGGGDGNVRISGSVGIMSTPVIDRERGVLFLVSRQKFRKRNQTTRFAPFEFVQRLHAIDIRTGRERAGSPIDIEASKGSIVFDPRIQNQRVGLALSRGHVIIGWGAHQDVGPYVGWVMSYRFARDTFTQTGVLVTTAAGNVVSPRLPGILSYRCIAFDCAQGGVWQTGRAPAVDSRGMILLFVGNGHNNTDDPGRTKTSFGNSFLRLDPETLAVSDFFTPANFSFLNQNDLDLGGSGPMIIPGSAFESVVGGGKEGSMYVWNLGGPVAPGSPSQLGGFTTGEAGVVQKFRASRFDSDEFGVFHGGHIMGGPVFWKGPEGSFLYNWSEDSQLRVFAVNPGSATPITTPFADRFTEAGGGLGEDGILKGHPGGILSLSADRSVPGTGIVWASTYDVGEDEEDAIHSLRPGVLRAFDAQNITRQLWRSNERERDQLGTLAKFNPPTVANGRVYMAAFGNDRRGLLGKLKVYGLRKRRYLRPAEAAAVRWWQTMAPVRKP